MSDKGTDRQTDGCEVSKQKFVLIFFFAFFSHFMLSQQKVQILIKDKRKGSKVGTVYKKNNWKNEKK